MKIVFGVNSRLYVWEIGISRLMVRSSSEEESAEEPVGIDPHGTVSAHMEISPDAIGAYGKHRFGFHGSQEVSS